MFVTVSMILRNINYNEEINILQIDRKFSIIFKLKTLYIKNNLIIKFQICIIFP